MPVLQQRCRSAHAAKPNSCVKMLKRVDAAQKEAGKESGGGGRGGGGC
jgi:hypothetical protein